MAFKVEQGGVWRTIGGRRVYIKDGQGLADAMRESGKFQKTTNDYMVRKWTTKVEKNKTNDLKPFEKQDVNIEKVKERGNLTDEEAKECIKQAEEVFAEAEALEPQISNDVINSSVATDGKMWGLDFRMKQPESLAAKIGADAKGDNISFDKASANVKDVVRYTVVYDDDNFVSGYNNFRDEMQSRGYTETRLKNFYELYRDGKACQKAVQCVYETENGYLFEVQFHTDSSQGAKEVNHPYYEKYRDKTTPDSRKQNLDKIMRDNGRLVKDPKGVYTIKSHG